MKLGKILLYLGGALVAAFIAWRVWAWMKGKKFAELFPRKDDRDSEAAAVARGANVTPATAAILPPSAQGLRVNAGLLDANRIGGNWDTLPLVAVQRFSPVGSTNWLPEA